MVIVFGILLSAVLVVGTDSQTVSTSGVVSGSASSEKKQNTEPLGELSKNQASTIAKVNFADSVLAKANGNRPTTANSFFREDELRPGYAVGWATNSRQPILVNDGSSQYLELDEDSLQLYLARLVHVESLATYRLRLKYSSACEVKVKLLQFDEKNNLLDESVRNSLQKGFHLELLDEVQTHSTTKRLMISIGKETPGTFQLYEVALAEVSR